MMRLRTVFLGVFLLLCGRAALAADAPYYLALGDSLAIGVQPLGNGTDVATRVGYVDDLYALLRVRRPGLRLAKLGCSGETTTTMIEGGVCTYPLGSQLAEAVAFLRTHHVALVTLDIGANNIDGCVSITGQIDSVCVVNGFGAAGADLPQILEALRQAAGPGVPIVAMNYYDAFLGAWRLGQAGVTLAFESLQVTLSFNSLLESAYAAAGVRVADVASAFHITDFTLIARFGLPENVLLALAWTWMSAPPPTGPDIHPNTLGYGVIAGAFVRALGWR
jgi:lysophospholipase L1-like esterase